jgi:hypothetical protein
MYPAVSAAGRSSRPVGWAWSVGAPITSSRVIRARVAVIWPSGSRRYAMTRWRA